MNILLTGGSGFIGGHTYEVLRKIGYRVQLFKGDVTKVEDWAKNLKPGADVIIHLAGVRTEKKKDFAVNAGGAKSLASALAKVEKRPKTIIFASTQAVYYGLTPPFTEDMPVKPPTIYGQSKLEAEKVLFKLPLRVVILRLSAVLGTGVTDNNMSGPLYKWTQQAKSGEPLVVFQGGEQTRDYVNVADVVAAILMAIKETKMNGIYNVGGKIRMRLVDLARKIKQLNQSQSEIIIKPGRPTVRDPKHLFSDTSKLAKFLNNV